MNDYNRLALRIERLLALNLLSNLKDSSLREKANILNKAGFTNYEVAELLDTSPQVIANYLSKTKKINKSKK